MNTLITNSLAILSNAEGHWEQIGATLLSGYAFVVAHGGITTMWSKFWGPSQSTSPEQVSQTQQSNKQIVG